MLFSLTFKQPEVIEGLIHEFTAPSKQLAIESAELDLLDWKNHLAENPNATVSAVVSTEAQAIGTVRIDGDKILLEDA